MASTNRISISVDQNGVPTIRGRKDYNFAASGQNSTGIAERHLDAAYHNNLRLRCFVGVRKERRFELALTGTGTMHDLRGLAIEWPKTRCLRSRTLEDHGHVPYRIEIEGRPMAAQSVDGHVPVATGLARDIAGRIAEDFDASRLIVRVLNPEGVCPLVNAQSDVLASPLRMKSFELTFGTWCRERRLEFRVTPLADPPCDSEMELAEPPVGPDASETWPDIDENGVQYASPDVV